MTRISWLLILLNTFGGGHINSLFSNSRGTWIASELQQLFDGPLLLFFALLTQLGDVWVLFVLASVLYVAGGYVPQLGIDKRQGAFIVALAIMYTVLITGFKDIFAVPRPPGAGVPPDVRWLPSLFDGMLTSVTTAQGFGFPSGHALGATMVWGGLALVADYRTRRTRLSVASGVIALVSFSRLALGVHYLIDVLAGIGIGGVVLLALYQVSHRGTSPEPVFLIAIVFGATGLLIRITFESIAAFGGAIGGWVAWRSVGDTERVTSVSKRALLLGFASIVIIGGLFGIVYIFEPSTGLTFLAGAATIGTVLGAPFLGEQLVEILRLTRGEVDSSK